jgi:uncharacterized protein
VARAGYDGLMQGRRLVVPGAGNKVVVTLTKFSPRRVTLALMEPRQRKRGRT